MPDTWPIEKTKAAVRECIALYAGHRTPKLFVAGRTFTELTSAGEIVDGKFDGLEVVSPAEWAGKRFCVVATG
jgi:hypothetical protein